MKVACVQMISGLDSERNWLAAARWVQEARANGAGLVLLPEMFLNFGQANTLDLDWQKQCIDRLSHLASSQKVCVVAGTIPLHGEVLQDYIGNTIPHDPRSFAATLVVDAEGKVSSVYTKLHLFDVDVNDRTASYRESQTYRPGLTPSVFEFRGHPVAMSVCYDLRFPELFLHYAEIPCDLIVVPSAFTAKTGKAHWEVLLRARAIENQCFVMAANQGGLHPEGRETWGHSMVIGPWGETIGKIEQGEGVLMADIDFGSLQTLRERMPIQRHRRSLSP